MKSASRSQNNIDVQIKTVYVTFQIFEININSSFTNWI